MAVILYWRGKLNYQRFPLDNLQTKRLETIDPRFVVERHVASIAPLASSFPLLVTVENTNKLDNEWTQLRNTDLRLPADVSEEHFWKCVRHTTQSDMFPMLPTLSDFVSKLLFLHCSATVERVFSQINLVKTKTRKRLEAAPLQAMLHAKQGLGGAHCYDFPVQQWKRHVPFGMNDISTIETFFATCYVTHE